jgi:hypothetical protein
VNERKCPQAVRVQMWGDTGGQQKAPAAPNKSNQGLDHTSPELCTLPALHGRCETHHSSLDQGTGWLA